MEQNCVVENLWRVWVDHQRRIVSFHEEEGVSCWNSAAMRCFCAAWTSIPVSSTGISDGAAAPGSSVHLHP